MSMNQHCWALPEYAVSFHMKPWLPSTSFGIIKRINKQVFSIRIWNCRRPMHWNDVRWRTSMRNCGLADTIYVSEDRTSSLEYVEATCLYFCQQMCVRVQLSHTPMLLNPLKCSQYILIPHAVAQLVEALYYSMEGRGLYYRWGCWIFLQST
jgi:hypothetical protein